MTKDVTFSGVDKLNISMSLIRLATWLRKYEMGKSIDAEFDRWLAPEGAAMKILLAENKHQIEEIITGQKDSQYSVAFVLDSLFDHALPCLLYKADDKGMLPASPDGAQIDVREFSAHINAIQAWRGFALIGGRMSVMTGIDSNVQSFLMKKLGVTSDEYLGVRLDPTKNSSQFKTYDVYFSFEDKPEDIVAAIQKVAVKKDMKDEIVRVWQDRRQVQLYANFNGRAVVMDEVPQIQALGRDGNLIRRDDFAPKAPKPPQP